MNKGQKGVVILPVLIIFLLIGALLFLIYKSGLLGQTTSQVKTPSTKSPQTSSEKSDLDDNTTLIPTQSKEGLKSYTSEEFGISFWLPESFYWNGGRSTKGEGSFTTPYILDGNIEVVKDVGKISCNLMREFLKNPSGCSNDEEIEYLLLNYLDPSTPNSVPVFSVGTPSWVNFEDSIGCSDCKYWYDQDVNILGNDYKVKVYYSLNSSGQRLTEGIQIEEPVPANVESKWKYFGIEPFMGFQDSEFTGPEAGLSQTSRKVLESLEYIN